jgi:putative effector of murein hydrolase LrgA (UPF0299 family)
MKVLVMPATTTIILYNIAMKNRRVTKILSLCSSMVVCLLKFGLEKATKMRRRMIKEKKE